MKKQFSSPASAGHILTALAVLAMLAVLIYANSFSGGFYFDDKDNILYNSHIRLTELSPSAVTGVFQGPYKNRPLALLTFAANYYFHQYDLFGFHLVNLLFHIITAFLVFVFTRQTLAICRLNFGWLPLLTALLWLANPLHTQSVTYILQRMTAMAAMFFLLALVCYIQARIISLRREASRLKPILLFAASIISGLLALCSKQNTAFLPLIVFLYEWYFFQDLNKRWLIARIKWIALAGVTCIAIAAVFLGTSPVAKILDKYHEQHFTLIQRLLTEPGVILYYLSLLVFPHPDRLTLVYNFPLSYSLFDPAATVAAIAALAALIILAVRSAFRHPLLSFSLLWFLGTLFIESSIIGLDLIFEHRTYLPSVFPCIAAAWLITKHIRPVPAAIILLAGIILIFGFWTRQRNDIWTNEIKFWQDATAKSPFQAGNYNNLGLAYRDAGKPSRALPCFRRSLDLNPQKRAPFTRLNLATILVDQGRYQEAVPHLKKILVLDPGYDKPAGKLSRVFPDAYNLKRFRSLCKRAYLHLGLVLQQTGKTNQARRHYEKALAIDPDMAFVWNNLGSACFSLGKTDKAKKCFQRAVKLNPDYKEAANNLKNIDKIIRKYGPIIDRLEAAAKRRPDHPRPLFRLGRVCQAAGMTDKAIHHYEKALKQKPDMPACLNAVTGLYLKKNRLKKATETMKQLVALTPDNPTCFYNLACLYARQNRIGPAVAALKKAIEKGYDHWEHLRTDPDLDNIRHTPYYRNLK